MKRKKIILSITAFFVLTPSLFLIYINFFIKDISIEELGPFPYPVNLSMFGEENFEYKQIREIGKKSKIDEFLEKISEHQKEKTPQDLAEEAIILMNNRKPKKDNDENTPSKEELLEYFNKNKNLIELSNELDLSKIKFPFSKINEQEANKNIINFLSFLYHKANYEVLFGNFESAYPEILKLNEVTNILIRKMPFSNLSIYPPYTKRNELILIIALLNRPNTSYLQKQKLLQLKHENTNIQTLINFYYLDEKSTSFNFYNEMDKQSETEFMIKTLKLLNPSYSCIYLPNKTKQEKREKLRQLIEFGKKQMLDNQKNVKLVNAELSSMKGIDYKSNFYGKMEACFSLLLPFIVLEKQLKIENMIHQLEITKALLEFKEKNGVLPNKLNDLKLDNLVLIDNMNDKPFVYSAKYGLLQRMESNYSDITIIDPEANLSPEEIKEIQAELDDQLITLQ